MPASYEKLWTYRYSVIVYDFTVVFCKRWLLGNVGNLSHLGSYDKRMSDQMIQAARSCKQNIVEGSEAMRTSLKSCIVLTNVARASLEELRHDYEDFLRQRELEQWSKNDHRVRRIRTKYGSLVSNLRSLGDLRGLTLHPNLEVAANGLITLCHMNGVLLSRQIEALEKKHQEEGGYSEKLYHNRVKYRSNKSLK